MKNKNVFLLMILGILLASPFCNAQDYKHPYGLVDSKGNVTDPDGKHLGSITPEGVINDAAGVQIAHVNAEGNVVDTKTGKVLGHAPKNGNFVYYYPENKKDSLMTTQPLNGTCEVTDSKGEKVVTVHENYKHIGACAYHCLYKKKHGEKAKIK
ncbi:MAG: DUF3659 domain-containing protein [Cytophagaceae bacterium]|nr:DUF3659 domain-containing protein [Cytophagaceae bacterium]